VPAFRTLVLSEVVYQRIQSYANFAGISIEDAATDAITEWMNSTGDLVVEALQKKRRASAAKPKLILVSSRRNRMDSESDLEYIADDTLQSRSL
jgi:hypothetical protein